MDERKREIRQLLLGHTMMLPNGRLAAVKRGQPLNALGIQNGGSAVRIFGVGHRTQYYTCKKKKPLADVSTSFTHVGRGVDLTVLPDAPCCICRYPMLSPIVLLGEMQGDIVKITAYSGRTPAMMLRRVLILRRLGKYLPSSLVRFSQEEEKQEKARRKAENQAAKEANAQGDAQAQPGRDVDAQGGAQEQPGRDANAQENAQNSRQTQDFTQTESGVSGQQREYGEDVLPAGNRSESAQDSSAAGQTAPKEKRSRKKDRGRSRNARYTNK